MGLPGSAGGKFEDHKAKGMQFTIKTNEPLYQVTEILCST